MIEQVIKPILFCSGIALLVYSGTSNWYLATAAGFALLNVLWTIRSSQD